MKVRGRRTYLIMGLVGIIGLLKGFLPDLITNDMFIAIESTLLALGGMTMRAGVANEASPRGVGK